MVVKRMSPGVKQSLNWNAARLGEAWWSAEIPCSAELTCPSSPILAVQLCQQIQTVNCPPQHSAILSGGSINSA
jgi:hypothetical protein